MKIPNEYLGTLNKMSADDLADWLLEGLRCWEESPPKNIPFTPIGLLLTHHEDIGVQLAAVYEKLDAPTQTRFRKGLAHGITRCRDVDEWQGVLRNMVWLAKTLKVADALQPIFFRLKGFLKVAKSKEALRSRAYVINILASWMEEPLVTQEFEQLLKKPDYFDKTDIPIIFLNLLKVHPKKLSEYAEQCRSYFLALEKEDQLYVRSLTLGLVDKMDLENLVRYLPDLYIPDIVLLKPNEIDNERWLLRMLFDKESAITFMRGKESDYICCGQQKSKISKNKWGDNYQLNWWLNEYFENKRIEDFSQKEKDTLIELLDKIDRVFKPINERHQNPPNDQIVIYA